MSGEHPEGRKTMDALIRRSIEHGADPRWARDNEIVLYLDEGANKLMVRLKYADGTAKDGELALT